MRLFGVIVLLTVFASLPAAATINGGEAAQRINERLELLVEMLKDLIAPITVAIFILAGLVYAVSQALDNETRMKGERWSISMVAGAAIGLFMVLAAPFLVDLLFGFGG